jgi:tripartite-type tricarboxylate transporter receptor subunit TctC
MLAVNQPSLLVVKSELPVKNVGELISELKKNPGKFNYASHRQRLVVAPDDGVDRSEERHRDRVHVPYAGSSQAVMAVMSGEAQMACLPALAVLPQVKAGKLRVIGASTAKRSSLLPDVPTLKGARFARCGMRCWTAGGVAVGTTTPTLSWGLDLAAALHLFQECVETRRWFH